MGHFVLIIVNRISSLRDLIGPAKPSAFLVMLVFEVRVFHCICQLLCFNVGKIVSCVWNTLVNMQVRSFCLQHFAMTVISDKPKRVLTGVCSFC